MINTFLNRIFRAIKIDIELFEEVEKDKNATFQAGAVVVLSSLAAGVGSIHLGASNFLIAPALSLLSWYVWAYVIYFVGVKLFGGVKTKSNHGELLRTIGFSSAPGLIRVFGITPELMTVTFLINFLNSISPIILSIYIKPIPEWYGEAISSFILVKDSLD